MMRTIDVPSIRGSSHIPRWSGLSKITYPDGLAHPKTFQDVPFPSSFPDPHDRQSGSTPCRLLPASDVYCQPVTSCYSKIGSIWAESSRLPIESPTRGMGGRAPGNSCVIRPVVHPHDVADGKMSVHFTRVREPDQAPRFQTQGDVARAALPMVSRWRSA